MSESMVTIPLKEYEELKKQNNCNDYDFSYPCGFYDFSCGVDIGEEQIKDWISDCIVYCKKQLDENKCLKHTGTSTGSGNTMVFVTVGRQQIKKDLFTVSVYVSKRYKSKTRTDVNLNK